MARVLCQLAQLFWKLPQGAVRVDTDQLHIGLVDQFIPTMDDLAQPEPVRTVRSLHLGRHPEPVTQPAGTPESRLDVVNQDIDPPLIEVFDGVTVIGKQFRSAPFLIPEVIGVIDRTERVGILVIHFDVDFTFHDQ